jgi:CheY-like chemotaxis protein
VEVVGKGIDLLIADIGLPGLSGIELYKKLKQIAIEKYFCQYRSNEFIESENYNR